MLIRNPQTQAAKPRVSTQERVEQLAKALKEGSAQDCIELLAGQLQLPSRLRKLMLQRMLTEPNVPLQQVFMNHLLPDLTAQELTLLLDQMNAEDAALRGQIIDGLSQVSQEQQQSLLLPELQQRLTAGDRDTRILTLNLITWLENPSLLVAVTQLLQQEQDINVCMTALDALPALGADPDLPELDLVAERFQQEPYASYALDSIRSELAALKAQRQAAEESARGNH